MLKMYRNAILSCAVAIALSFANIGGAFSQTAAPATPAPGAAPAPAASAPAAPVAPAAPATAAAPKEKSKKSASAPSGEKRQGGRGYVYLLRGLLNVFSLGMDDLAAKLQARGVSAGVYEYGSWESLCNDAAARVRNGGGPIVIVGHSLGADAVVDMANRLGNMGVPVALVVAFDPTVHNVLNGSTTANFINYYQSDNGFGRPVARGPGFHGNLSNIDLRRHTEFGHASIDKSAMLHAAVIGRVLGLVGRGSPKPKSDAAKTDAVAPAASAPAAAPTPHADTGAAPHAQ